MKSKRIMGVYEIAEVRCAKKHAAKEENTLILTLNSMDSIETIRLNITQKPNNKY